MWQDKLYQYPHSYMHYIYTNDKVRRSELRGTTGNLWNDMSGVYIPYLLISLTNIYAG